MRELGPPRGVLIANQIIKVVIADHREHGELPFAGRHEQSVLLSRELDGSAPFIANGGQQPDDGSEVQVEAG